MDDQQLDALARAIDERLLALEPGCDPARLFGVRLREEGFVLVPFWSGVPRELPPRLVPPDGCVAIALESGGWTAPLDDDGTIDARPSKHPKRQRMHNTCIVYGASGTDVSVLRQGNDPPRLLRGGVGVIPDLMRACWANRRDAAA